MAWILVEYLCGCGRTESLETRGDVPDFRKCERCGQVAERVISAVRGRVEVASVYRGKSEERASPAVMDTRAMADGMTRGEWKQQRSKMWFDRDRAERKRKLGV